MRTLLTMLVVAVGAFAFLYLGYEAGARTVQAKWDTEKADTITAQRTKEARLQAGMDQLRKEKNRETAKLQRTVAALTLSLRNRPERPAVPASASAGDAGRWCSGPQLYRDDAAVAIAEAERADTIRLALITCQKAYQDAADKSAGR